MELAELLTSDHIRLHLRCESLQDALWTLLEDLGEATGLGEGDTLPFAHRLAQGETGDLVPLGKDAVLALARSSDAPDLVGALGILARPVEVRYSGEEAPQEVRGIVLLLTPRRLSTLRPQVIPALSRVFRDGDRARAILSATTPGEIRENRDLMDLILDERLLVEDALSPVSYRVYPHTPMEEVLDLITRRELRAVPVVGENYEVLGIITGAEALKYSLEQRKESRGKETAGSGTVPRTARDVMSRTVMCVAEDQSLLEAANLMASKNVAQLPVVREGELIGFLTRDAVLARLKR